jgi:hypothetical protein
MLSIDLEQIIEMSHEEEEHLFEIENMSNIEPVENELNVDD